MRNIALYTMLSLLLAFQLADTVYADSTGSFDVVVDWNSLTYKGIGFTVLGDSFSRSEASGVVDFESGIADTAAFSVGPSTTTYATTSGNALISHSDFQFIQPPLVISYTGGYTVGALIGSSIATRTVSFRADQTGALLIDFKFDAFGTQSLDQFGVVPGVGPASVRSNAAPFTTVLYSISGPGFSKRGYTELWPLGSSNDIRLLFPEGDYQAGDIGTFSITATTGFRFSEVVVPEPSSIGLLLTGVLMIGLLRKYTNPRLTQWHTSTSVQ
jgi:hypothetical protein